MKVLEWIGNNGWLALFLGVFVVVPVVAAIFGAGRARAFRRCPKCGFSNKEDDDE